jgi:hypothetical protein
MWAYKGVVVLVSGDQPDAWFELALVWSGASILLLVYAMRDQLVRSSRLLAGLGWVAGVAGGTASAAYILDGDDGLFGPAAVATVLSTVVVLFLIGGDIHRGQLLAKYSFAPRLLAWLYVVSLPLGAALSGIDERLIEIALLGTVAGWVILALGSLGRTSP